MSSALWSGAVLSCPLNRVVDVEQHSGALLTFRSVAVSTYFECSDEVARKDMPTQGDLTRCIGPYGDTFIKATLGGGSENIYIAYRVIHGSPCCYFQSSYRLDDLTSQHLEWDEPDRVPVVNADSWAINIEDNVDPWPMDKGPLAGKKFRFHSCRAD